MYEKHYHKLFLFKGNGSAFHDDSKSEEDDVKKDTYINSKLITKSRLAEISPKLGEYIFDHEPYTATFNMEVSNDVLTEASLAEIELNFKGRANKLNGSPMNEHMMEKLLVKNRNLKKI